ncbi:MAG: hypothetical protein GY703_19800 [Gammaproteobacteria bacterium]|nr:hypothetical protein [Gammaproteobacteria bacterium]
MSVEVVCQSNNIGSTAVPADNIAPPVNHAPPPPNNTSSPGALSGIGETDTVIIVGIAAGGSVVLGSVIGVVVWWLRRAKPTS